MTCKTCEEMRRRALEAWRQYAPRRPPNNRRNPVKRLYEQAARERTVTVVWPSGEPVRSGDVKPGSMIEFEVGTGKVVRVDE